MKLNLFMVFKYCPNKKTKHLNKKKKIPLGILILSFKLAFELDSQGLNVDPYSRCLNWQDDLSVVPVCSTVRTKLFGKVLPKGTWTSFCSESSFENLSLLIIQEAEHI